MKRILVPTDFSECANQALKAATLMAKKLQADVHLLHIMDVPVDWMALGNQNQQNLYPDITAKVKAVNVKLAELVKQLEDNGVTAHFYLEYNSDHKAIIKFSESLKIDMIIMGTKGASGLKEFFIGSLSQKIVRLAECPVLVVEHLPDSFKLENIVVATDLSMSGMSGFKKAVELLTPIASKIKPVFINTPVTFTETDTLNKKWNRYAQEINGTAVDFSVYNTYDFEKGLTDFSKQNGDLLVMISHGRGGGLTESMVNHLKMPILSVSV